MADYSAFPRAANLIVRFIEAVSLLANNGVGNGQTIDSGFDENIAGSGFSKFRAMVFSDQAGTLNIQQSRDGTTWRTTASQTVTASSGTILESLVTRQFVRASFTNTGGSTQTIFELDAALVAI